MCAARFQMIGYDPVFGTERAVPVDCGINVSLAHGEICGKQAACAIVKLMTDLDYVALGEDSSVSRSGSDKQEGRFAKNCQY